MIQPEPDGSTQRYPLLSVEVLRYDKRSKSEKIRIVPTEMELILEHTQQGISHEISMEILLEPTSNKLMVGYEWMIDDELFEMITLSMCHKITLASDTLIDFQIKFSISIGETATHWFTLIVLSALRRSDNENMLSLMNTYVKLKDGGEGTCFQLSQRFITTCSYPTIKYKDIMKARVHVSGLPLL
nr:hypothetical protein [Tanacetum cinerariifolium]